MITNLEINNMGSINHIEINFEKAKYKFLENMIFNNKIVNPIAFYGTNGSGKSSFLSALSSVVSLMIEESNLLRPFVPNLLNLQNYIKGHKEDYSKIMEAFNSNIKLNIQLDENCFEYFLETNTLGYISHEYLYANKQLAFERFVEKYKVGSGKFKKCEKTLYPTLRQLANDENINNEQIKIFFEYLSNIACIDANRKNYLVKQFIRTNYLDFMVDKSKEVKEMLEKYKEFPLYDVYSTVDGMGNKLYWANINMQNNDLKLPLQYISDGMTHNSVLLSIVAALPKNSTMIIDEIEDALHPLTIIDFLNIIKERNIQLIFSSHNTYILQNLRPDQIFFANWDNGYSKYKRLSNIYPNIREINNIEKMYLGNLFTEEIKGENN